jgi:hypothetical protein
MPVSSVERTRVALDRLIPEPGRREVDTVELAVSVDEAWEVLRHTDLADTTITRALFAIRSVPGRLRGRHAEPFTVRIDDLVSTEDRPGFAVLLDEPPRHVAVGAIGKVWQPDIPFRHVPDADAYLAFDEGGWVKVAWSITLVPLDERTTRVDVEVRVAATDPTSWTRFRRYFRLIGPASRFIRRHLLAGLARRHGLGEREREATLPGDELLPDAADHVTLATTIDAGPDRIWPWLVQMGCDRAGFYSLDLLDNGGVRSAREIHPDLQHLDVGQVLPAAPGSDEGFEVLQLEPERFLVLGGLFDVEGERQLPFADPRPQRFWHVTWAFVLQPWNDGTTRLIARARAAASPDGAGHLRWIRPIHHVMQRAQLRNLGARAEGRVRNDDRHDVAEGVAGAAVMAAGLLTPFRRVARSRWGVDEETAARALPGDDLVADPRWQWTHGIDVDVPAESVWPWIAQIGADRAGCYSYQWLENIPGCGVRNAETVHPEWAAEVGDGLLLHPKVPPLPIVHVEPGRCVLAHAPPEPGVDPTTDSWVEVTWLFLVEPLDQERCRVISRYRCATSDDFATRLQFGPTLVEPVSFAMDRRMLQGIKARAERAAPRQTGASSTQPPPASAAVR